MPKNKLVVLTTAPVLTVNALRLSCILSEVPRASCRNLQNCCLMFRVSWLTRTNDKMGKAVIEQNATLRG
jgi:hypothetical protein